MDKYEIDDFILIAEISPLHNKYHFHLTYPHLFVQTILH